MRCQRFRAQLTPYMDGELSLPARQQCDEHMRDCPACRQALACGRQLVGRLWDVAVPPMPEGMAERVLSAVQATPAPHMRPKQHGWAWRGSLARRVAAVLIFAAGLAIGGWMAGQAVPRAAASPASASPETAALDNDLNYLGGDQDESLPHVCQNLVPQADAPAP